jgi:hypothetical protein
MLERFFALATISPRRQLAFRRAVTAHLCVLAACAGWLFGLSGNTPFVGYTLLTAGIVEGAILIGWRLTQLPKSQALEFVLVTPLRPSGLFLAETAVSVSQLALLTLSGLPVLTLLLFAGHLEPLDLPLFLIMPFTWGVVTGLGLIVWAYEAPTVRRYAERCMLVLIVIYLIVGVLAGEHLGAWIDRLPKPIGAFILQSLESFHSYNPFAIVRLWFIEDFAASWESVLGVECAAAGLIGILLVRAAGRLHGHFHDRHYRPVDLLQKQNRGSAGERPLSWWAVRRVSEYSGRVNLWLAGGFGLLYALYTLAGPAWPSWLGKRIFLIFDASGGIPLWATALCVLAAVPAAFQYGLWDSNAHERCRRLELLLLTNLSAADYWHAAAAAAWRRGRGYFAIAGLLWASAAAAGSVGVLPAGAGCFGGVLLWCLYFAMGFRAFSRGLHANRLGLALTIGLPAIAFVLGRFGWSNIAALLPPGSVYYAGAGTETLNWLVGCICSAGLCLVVIRIALRQCEAELRSWYGQHHGRLVID